MTSDISGVSDSDSNFFRLPIVLFQQKQHKSVQLLQLTSFVAYTVRLCHCYQQQAVQKWPSPAKQVSLVTEST